VHAVLVVAAPGRALHEGVAALFDGHLGDAACDQLAGHRRRHRVAAVAAVGGDGARQPLLGELAAGIDDDRLQAQHLGLAQPFLELLFPLPHVHRDRQQPLGPVFLARQVDAHRGIEPAAVGERDLPDLGNRDGGDLLQQRRDGHVDLLIRGWE
jgi:hypothetical protein